MAVGMAVPGFRLNSQDSFPMGRALRPSHGSPKVGWAVTNPASPCEHPKEDVSTNTQKGQSLNVLTNIQPLEKGTAKAHLVPPHHPPTHVAVRTCKGGEQPRSHRDMMVCQRIVRGWERGGGGNPGIEFKMCSNLFCKVKARKMLIKLLFVRREKREVRFYTVAKFLIVFWLFFVFLWQPFLWASFSDLAILACR